MTYQEEAWEDVWQEISQHFQAHFNEAGIGIFEFDYARYHKLAEKNLLVVITARDERIVGYHVSFISRTGHNKEFSGYEDFFYMLPSHRGRHGIKRLAKTSWLALKKRGIRTVIAGTKKQHLKIYQGMGYEPMEILMVKEL